jgi:hypothetical protein
LKHPDIVLVCLPLGIAFGWYYFFIAVLPSTFGPIYGFAPGTVGLCFIASGVGNAAGSITAGRVSDKYYAKTTMKNGGVAKKENRLRLNYVAVPFIFVGTILYGWFLYAKLHWIAPLVAFALSKQNMFVHDRLNYINFFRRYVWYHVYNYSSKHVFGGFQSQKSRIRYILNYSAAIIVPILTILFAL